MTRVGPQSHSKKKVFPKYVKLRNDSLLTAYSVNSRKMQEEEKKESRTSMNLLPLK
jgi:hypothetical protein